MKDVLNNELAVGDRVVVIQWGYRSLMEGTVTRFTAKKVEVAYGKPFEYKGETMRHKTLREPSGICKAPA